MPSTNGHDHKRAILYARVFTDELVRSRYSLAQQPEARQVEELNVDSNPVGVQNRLK